MALVPSLEDMQKTIQLGPFELGSVIGSGGMGEVWTATHISSGVNVAVKVLTSQGAKDAEYLQMFRHEIRSVAALDHPGIILVFDMGTVDEEAERQSGGHLRAQSPYLVMEQAARGSLDRYVQAASWPIVRHIGFRVLDALAHAHARGMVHRDLKPQNLLVGCAGEDPLGLKIADFGLAHPMDLTGRTGRYERGWGTPAYMAPEQFRGRFRDYGPWTDLYALGIIMWELTTGRLPFEAPDVVSLSSLHLHAELPEYRPIIEVPAGFQSWVRRLLQKEIRQRFPTAAHAATALRQVLGIGAHEELDADESLKGAEGAQLLNDGPHALISPQPSASHHAQTTVVLDPGQFAMPAASVPASRPQPVGPSEPAAPAHPNQTLAPVVAPPIPPDWRPPDRSAPTPQLLGAGLGLYGLRTVPMVDRQQERDWLWAQLRAVHQDGQARMVILRGSTGTGKSRLARWLCERASELGVATILAATHSEPESAHDGLAPLLARHFGCVGLERTDVMRHLERQLQADGVAESYEWLALTELFAPLGEVEAEAEEERDNRTRPLVAHVRLTSHVQRYALLRRALERIARIRPVIVWLDDVQWGLDALHWAEFLLAGADPIRAPVLLLATAHQDILAERPAARDVLDALAELPSAQARLIEPLPASDTAELVRRLLMLDGELAEQVEARSGGNPMFAVQLVGDWVAGGKLRVGAHGFCLQDGEAASIPDEIHQIWRDRVEFVLAQSLPQSRTALELAAALGLSVERAEWREGCMRAGITLDPALEERLLEHALAELNTDASSAAQGSWRFAHRMLRESLERNSREAGRWSQLNAVCADVLDALYPQSPREAQRRARYLFAAGRSHAGIESLLLAARYHSERSDLQRAHRLLDEHAERLNALNIADMTASVQLDWLERQRAHALTLRAEIFSWAGRFKQALESAQKAVDRLEHKRWYELSAAAFYALGRAALHLGQLQRAEESFHRAQRDSLHTQRPDHSVYPGLSTLGVARVAQARGDFASADTLLHQAIRLLGNAGDDQALARCYNALGDVARKAGRLDDAQHHAQKARELFEAGGHQAGVADCLNDLAELHHMLGDFQAAEQHCLKAIDLYESIGSERAMAVRLNLAFLWLEAADFERARQLIAPARDHFERGRQLAELAQADALLMGCAASEHDWSAWEALYVEAHLLATTTGLRDPRIARALHLAADLAATAQQPVRARNARSLALLFATSPS